MQHFYSGIWAACTNLKHKIAVENDLFFNDDYVQPTGLV